MTLTDGMAGRMQRRLKQMPGNLQGALWIAVGGLVLTIMTALIKTVGEAIPVIQILFLRQVVMTGAMMPRILRNPREALATNTPKLHLARILLSTMAMTAGFTAMVHLPLADAVAISFSRSFFVAILAIFILHEIVGRHRWTGIAAGFAGVLVITNPSGGDINHYVLMALFSAAAVALIMVIVRMMAQQERLATVIIYQALGVGAILAIPAMILWVPPTPTQWLLLICIGLLSTLGQSLNFMAFRVGEATALAPVDYIRLIYSTAIGAIFFLEQPTWTTMAGALLVILGTFWGLWHERRGNNG